MVVSSALGVLRVGAVLLFALALFIGLPSAHPTRAAAFTVNDTTDAVDANPGDGVCETGAGNGDCTLRAAIMETNALAGADTITLPTGTYALTIAGRAEDAAATGDLDISGDLTINGAGAASTIVDGGAVDTVFEILSGATVEIAAVTIRNGLGQGYPGGIANLGTVNMSDCTITGNHSSGGTNAGGAFNFGTMVLNNCVVSDNTAGGNGGGLFNTHGTLTLNDSTVSGNTTTDFRGGGIGNNGGTVNVNNSTVSGNTATTLGGGVWSDSVLVVTGSSISGNTANDSGGGIDSEGTLTLADSTVSNNTAAIQGGGISDPGTASLTNVTVSGNSVPGDGTGGVYNPSGDMTITNSTIVGNSATHTGGLRSLTTATIKNTIIADNTGPDCTGNPGAITSAGHNLDSDGTCPLTGPGDLSNIADPMLGPLTDNGGPTQTRALLAGSPAIDAGSSDCPPPATDQRGVSRPQGPACDIGAFEFQPGTSRIWGDDDCGGDIGPRDAQATLKNVLVQTPLSQIEPCPDVGSQVTVDGVSRIWGDTDCGGDIGPRDAQAILKNVLVQSPLSQTQPCPPVGSTVQVVG